MELSLGFVFVLILIIFPGILYRRLYFYGEFSKEFRSDKSLISLISASSIPGIINLILIYFLYDTFYENIDLGAIIDNFKNINSENFRYQNVINTPLKELIYHKAAPFVGFLYLNSFIFGAISGRIVRLTHLDTKFKLLRFNNYWFYLFNGKHTNFPKMKHLKLRNQKHLFTKADILIDSNNKTELYSGIIVDYELSENGRDLKKVVLQNAKRYSHKDCGYKSVDIPGNLFVVNCSSMKNINLTYVYEKNKNILETKLPLILDTISSLIVLFAIPAFIFKANFLTINIYDYYFSLKWYQKIFAFLLFFQIVTIINPFERIKNEYKWISKKAFISKLIWIIIFVVLIWILN